MSDQIKMTVVVGGMFLLTFVGITLLMTMNYSRCIATGDSPLFCTLTMGM